MPRLFSPQLRRLQIVLALWLAVMVLAAALLVAGQAHAQTRVQLRNAANTGPTGVNADPLITSCAAGCGSPLPWTPTGDAALTTSTSSARVALPNTDGVAIIINTGAQDEYFKLGNGSVTAAATDHYLQAGGFEVVAVAGGQTNLAAISPGGASSLVVKQGTGGPTIGLKGSGSSGGGDASAANQNTQITDLGGVTETAPATDTASSGLNGRLQRIAQRITSLITALGSPFQAGGSIGNTGFASTSTITGPTSTPTISTSAYSTGMVLGGIQSFTSQPNSGTIANAHVQFASGTFSGSVDLELFSASPTGGGTSDHAAYALTATDTGKKIGELHLNDCTSDGGALVSCQNLYQSQFYGPLPAAGTTIFFVAVVRGAPTFAGTTDAIFSAAVVK